MTLGTQARIGQDLGHGIARGRRPLVFPGNPQGLDIVHRMVIGNVLQRICNTLNQIFLFYADHLFSPVK